MFRRRLILLALACLAFPVVTFSQPRAGKGPAQYVNPFIGTGGHGHTYPGAQLPFGMVQLSPDTRLSGWDGCSAYHYSDTVVYGFSHTHLSGTGCSDYGDILLMPTTGEIQWKNTDYASAFKHEKETASAGYYSTELEKYNIRADLTATKRAGFHRYTYPRGTHSNIILDLKHRDDVIESSVEIVGNDEIRGMRRSKAWALDQAVYFVVKFSKAFEKSGILDDNQPIEGKKEVKGKNLKAYVSFSTDEQEAILVKVGISGASIAGAVKNLEAEIPDWNFEAIKDQAYQAWNAELSKILVESKNPEDMTVFYTALYHSMLAPVLYSDVDGSFRGRDFNIHTTSAFDYYTVFSLWDTYRAAHPLFTLIDEKRTNDFINTFITQYEQGGLLPVWELSSNETYCMIGYHAVPVIADAFIKGIKGYDTGKALTAMKHSANTDKFGLPQYREYGYVPGDAEHESVSKTLEYAYDDWCIAQVARGMDEQDEYTTFIRRAQSYKNLFDPSTGFMRPRINGGWYSPFDPTEVNNHFTEANSWQYSFYVPQDIDGLIKLHGGKSKLSDKLDELFTTDAKLSGRNQVDITGLIGQYAHGNEPSHHIAYLYDFTGEAWKTQQKVHQIMTELYLPSPDGLSGNEDCGQLSAWFVWSAMGFYPVCPGQTQYAIGTPYFDNITIKQENGNQFTITANNLSYNNYYIQSAKLNGQAYNRSFISHQLIRKGGTLELTMGPSPNKQWASTNYDIPRTMITTKLIVPVPFISAESRTFSDSLLITMGDIDPAAVIHFTLNGDNPDTASPVYTMPFYLKDNTSIKAIACLKKDEKSQVCSATFLKIPGGRKIRLNTAFENQYTAGGPNGLIDGIRGTLNWRLGNWQGYLNTDLDAIVDLGKVQQINNISIGLLQDIGSWIWFPREVVVSASSDGKKYKQIAVLKPGIPEDDYTVRIKELSVSTKTLARFIRVKAGKYGRIPSWHPGAGEDSHLFVDEIVVE